MSSKIYIKIFIFCVFSLTKSYADKAIIVSHTESIDSFGDDKVAMISRENRKREFEERVIAYEEKIPHELGRQFDRIPDGKEDYYPLMPKEDRVFWIDVFKNYTNYSLNEKPTRPTFLCDKVSETNVWFGKRSCIHNFPTWIYVFI